jgi:carbonic anhydrase
VTGAGQLERLIEQNQRFAETFEGSGLSAVPRTGLAILTCMDARIAVEDALGLHAGDAHVIRNAGGLASADAIRSIVVSQQLLGTSEVLVIAHTSCGLLRADEDDLRQRVEASTGVTPTTEFGTFPDLESMVREQVSILQGEPTILAVPVHGLIYEVETGRLRQVV